MTASCFRMGHFVLTNLSRNMRSSPYHNSQLQAVVTISCINIPSNVLLAVQYPCALARNPTSHLKRDDTLTFSVHAQKVKNFIHNFTRSARRFYRCPGSDCATPQTPGELDPHKRFMRKERATRANLPLAPQVIYALRYFFLQIKR